MSDKTSNWPKIRVNPAAQTRMENILKRAKNGMSLIEFQNAILTETLDQIESAEDSVPLAPIVLTLRSQLGKRAVQDVDADILAEIVEIKKRVRELEIERNARVHLLNDPAETNEDKPSRKKK